MKKVIIFALTLALAGAVPASEDNRPDAVSPALMSELNAWLDAETEYAARGSQAHIRLIGAQQAEALHGVADRSGGRLRGLYDAETGTIYLTEPWSATDTRDISILLHELVHHRQAGQHWYCAQAQEWRAYQIQAQWLSEQGLEDGFYWPAIVLHSSCARRDIHPE